MDKEEGSQIFIRDQGLDQDSRTGSNLAFDSARADFDPNSGLKRGLQTRHVTLMALGGIIGPGSVVGLGVYLHKDGPASLLVDYSIVGLVAFSLMQSIGELNSLFPATNGFSNHITRFVGEAFAAMTSYNYVIVWICVMMAEYTTLTATMNFWAPEVPAWGYFLIFWAFFMSVQFLGVTLYGEAEFWLAIFKLIGLTAFYIFTIIYMCGGVRGTPAFGFHNFKTPWAGQAPVKSLANAIVNCSTAYSGIELMSLNAAETKNPIRAIPIAVRQTLVRIFYVYLGITLSFGISAPYDSPLFSESVSTLRSPIYVALYNAGWHSSYHLVNAFIVIISLSAINSAIYIGTRTIVNMANEKLVPFPNFFRRVNRRGVPYVAAVTFHLFGFLSLLSVGSGTQTAYSYFVSVSGVSTFFVWGAISVCQLRFRRGWVRSGRKVSDLPYQCLGYPFTPLFSVVMNIFLALIQGWMYLKPFQHEWFIDAYIMFPLSLIFLVSYKIWKKTKLVPYEEMDFETGRRYDLEEEFKQLKAQEKLNPLTRKQKFANVFKVWI
ncbi:hypothetical protein OGAPHI_005808 [Ogataea philodendri]|uniref:Amino acid permease/ SLC12A domain-containing protein n=1 Tax=Ogataea philodendri TaxID=1378263 RepID=A0A9P8T2B4_9ASCO|nr:uncharacterized protein OGAPHI_005808 [Ogataea philodendri]KAH3662556.1 hypothetical protein OGAPHI_005808 [Ogataea philodendri]